MGLNPIGFSDRAFSFNKAVIKQRIIEAKISSPEYRAEIRRIFQQANRRIQNIESKGLVSPAVMALNKGDIQGFTKFSMKHDWEDLKAEYAKAVSFLRQPTSTATGVREYNKHLMDAYDLTEDEFNLMADKIQEKFLSVSDDNFVEQYLMRYKDFTGELEAEAADVSEQIESDAQMLQAALEEDVERSAQSALDNANNIKKGLLGMLKKFGL
jgi:hypothetical protein